MSKGVKAGDAFIKVSLDGGEKAFRALQDRLRGIGNGLAITGGAITAAGAGILGVFGAASKAFATAGANLDDMSARTGVGAAALSGLGYAAEQSGSDLGTVEKGLIGMTKTMAGAAEGAKGKVEALEALGTSYDELKNLAPEKQFEVLADKISKVEDPIERSALSMKVFGKAGQQLLPLFADGAEGIRALTGEAEQLGLVMSDEDSKAAAALDDAMAKLWTQLDRVWVLIGAAVAGPLTELLNWSIQFIAMALHWLDANRQLVATIAAVAAAVVGIGAALIGAAAAFFGLSFVAGGLAAGLSAVGAVLAFILSPLGLVLAAIAGAAVYFFGFTEAGRAMVDSALGYFGELGAIVGETFGGMKAALMNGDINAAAEILWAGLQVLWATGTAPLRKLWSDVSTFLVNTWQAAITGVSNASDTVWTNLTIGMNNLVAFFERMWARIKGLFGGDATAEIARINKELEASNKIITEQRDARKNKRNEDLQAKFDANFGKADEALVAAEKKLADAKAKLAKMSSEQQAEAAERAKKAAEKATKGAEGAAARNTKAGDSGSGTFSAAAIASLLRVGNEDLADRTAEASERTATATEKLADLRPLMTAP
jgi:hypothetical protein